MSFTAKEVDELINKHLEENDGEYDGYVNFYSWLKDSGYYDDNRGKVEFPGLGTVEYVEDFGGEGQGDDYWVVFKVGEQFFKKNGWYASYDGGELDGELYEVEPVEVTRTEYQVKK